MTAKLISFEELMAECNFDDKADFQRVLRKNGFDVPRRKPIDSRLANEVTKRLIGRKLDWYKYKKESANDLSNDLLNRISVIEHEEVARFFLKLQITDVGPYLSKDAILGVVVTGSFLAEEDNTIVLRLSDGINVLIGDRGSGKSTALSLLSILAESVSEETGILVDNLLGLLGADSKSLDFSVRLQRELFKYGVTEYVSFYSSAGKLYCFYVSQEMAAFDFLEYSTNRWISVEPDLVSKPKTQLLRQGEVIQIADTQNNFYLNNVLDALFPDLHLQRQYLVRKINTFVKQINNFRKIPILDNRHGIQHFIEMRESDLQRLRIEISKGFISGQSLRILEEYVRIFESLDKRQLSQLSIVKLLQTGGEANYFLYLSRIIKFLSEKLREMKSLERQRSQTRSSGIDVPAVLDLESIKPDSDPQNEDSAEYDQLIQEIADDKQILDPDVTEVNDDAVSADIDYDEESKLFLNYMLEADSPVHKELNSRLNRIAETVEDFLRVRLGILKTWWWYYAKDFSVCDTSLLALVGNYTLLLNERYELIKTQEEKCKYLTDALKKDNLEISISTLGIDDREREIRVADDMLNSLEARYFAVVGDKPDTPLAQWRTRTYKRSLNFLFEEIRQFQSRIESKTNNDFLFSAIEISMRQGSVNRDFNQLSFGQKSSIILNVVFQCTDKSILIIDQPEDNLDAYSIVKTLAPTLNRLGQEKQVIIATHNSNLVLGLNTGNVMVLESLGQNGRIKLQGSPFNDREIIEAMVEILEGGLESFALKIRTFEDFVSRAGDQIRDIDINMIESSFRRRTIDDLRNFLQPIVSDKTMLDFARHELKQEQPAIIQQNALALVDFSERHREDLPYEKEFLLRINKLLVDLNSHIETLKTSIENIRLMDTEPNLGEVNLFVLLQDIKEKILMPRLSRSRRNVSIEIDPALEGCFVLFDEGHLKLIFHNLINNSLRATELKSVVMKSGTLPLYQERVEISLDKKQDDSLQLLIKDNGRGIPHQLKDKLYVVRCSDQRGRDDGLGGVTIRKLLDINLSQIQILQTSPEIDGTIQKLFLRLVKKPERTETARDLKTQGW